ncbi:MAG: hypothetical protein ACOZNI_19590 [Myxococcota bacterium]
MMLLALAALAATPEPAALPTAVAAAGEEEIVVWRRGERAIRALANGVFRETAPAAWSLAGGWTIDGPTVRRDGREVATLTAAPEGAAVAGDTFWVDVGDGLARVREGEAPARVVTGKVGSFAPFAGGVAVAGGRRLKLYDAGGRATCGSAGRPLDVIASPDGHALVLVDPDGLAVLDDHCRLVAGAPIGGEALGFLDAGRLAVVDRAGAIHVLAWPSLEAVHHTPPTVDPRWAIAQGPSGPVLANGRHVFDPQTGTFVTLPLGALVLREAGLALASDTSRVRVLDLGGTELRSIPVGLEGPPRGAWVDGSRVAVTDGFVVVQHLPDGRVDRWSLAEPIARVLLRPEGAVELRTATDARRLLRPGEPSPAPAPRLADPEALTLPNGDPLRLAWGDVASVRAVHAASGPARVFDVATLRTLGAEVPVFLEQMSLAPDARWLVGIAEGRARAFEVATGWELWSVQVERSARVVAFSTFVAVEGGRRTRLLDPRTGAEVWSVGAPDERRDGELVVVSRDGVWKSDAIGGATARPVWSGALPEVATPALGEPLAARPEPAVAEGTSPAPVAPLSWPDATVGGDMARLRPLRRGRSVATDAGRFAIPYEGEPTVVLYGQGAAMPASAPPGVTLLAVVTDADRVDGKYPRVVSTPELARRLRLGPGPGALLVSADGRELARGSAEEVLAVAERAGLEERRWRIRRALEPAWTLRAPALVETVSMLRNGVVIGTAGGFAVLSLDGQSRWTGEGTPAIAAGDTVVEVTDHVEARAAADGVLRWRAPTSKVELAGDRVRLREAGSGGERMVDLDTGALIDVPTRPRVAEMPGEPWFAVPGGWCRTAGPCVRRDPARSVTIGAHRYWVEDRRLRCGKGGTPGVVRVLQLDPTRAIVQLGNEAGPWVVVQADGRLGPLLGYGAVAAAGEGVVVVARGAEVRGYRVPHPHEQAAVDQR